MAHVQVGFGTIIGDIYFTVLKRIHGTGIDVYVGVEFLKSDGQPPTFQQRTDGGGGEALAQRGKNSAGDEDKFCPFGVVR